MMEEALMDHRMLRRLVLEQKLIDYVDLARGNEARYFECEAEFGVAYLWWTDYWNLLWITVEECPVDLDKLPKEGM